MFHVDLRPQGSPCCCLQAKLRLEAPGLGQAIEDVETGFLGPTRKTQCNPRGPVGALGWAVCLAEANSKQFPPQLVGKITVYVEGVGSHPSGLLGSLFLPTRLSTKSSSEP